MLKIGAHALKYLNINSADTCYSLSVHSVSYKPSPHPFPPLTRKSTTISLPTHSHSLFILLAATNNYNPPPPSTLNSPLRSLPPLPLRIHTISCGKHLKILSYAGVAQLSPFDGCWAFSSVHVRTSVRAG